MQLNTHQFKFAVVQTKVGETKHGRTIYKFEVISAFLLEHNEYTVIALAASLQNATLIADALNQSIKINIFKQLFSPDR